MAAQLPRYLTKTLFIFLIATLVVANARPNHFGDASQVVGEPADGNNLLDSRLKPWELEMLVQRLSEISSQTGGDFAWDKSIRLPEAKRQSRYRQCYFNPISCFRK
ncbi:allatotropin II preprohormone isoform X1 [Tribolium castaneum]|uniref:Allatostatin C preprohormone n=1 Tax=Tribolium castaneum TaxID=7070 RepID=B8XQ59_TRICA|nr:allatotropin II preprohormone precursor [Tribolium castaneum]XP_008197343.1 PREDICTED: allatotropin II preprohormone isoform X1 [Tribolium castaneum]XP_008197344.1 PREDICTED: allatotropin II preprohormone isoform X1 [Tribolium castaneum]ACJ38500.1 allatostatin C preprohormone [Tribolium castaneum]EFA09152.2 allatostatin-C [Tribolium castaneum]|eukprot:NP_001137205.1 allatotropin II preprohormone precursor [Tribolium castaneum]